MLEIKDSVTIITSDSDGIGLAKYWVENGDKVMIGDIAEMVSLAGELYGNEAPTCDTFLSTAT